MPVPMSVVGRLLSFACPDSTGSLRGIPAAGRPGRRRSAWITAAFTPQIRVDEDLAPLRPKDMTKLSIKAALGVWYKAPCYLLAIAAVGHRHDLRGKSVAPVSAEAMAKTKLGSNDGQRKKAQWSSDRRDETVQRMWLRQESDRVRRRANRHLQGLRLVRSAQSLGGDARSGCAKGVTGWLVSRPTAFFQTVFHREFPILADFPTASKR